MKGVLLGGVRGKGKEVGFGRVLLKKEEVLREREEDDEEIVERFGEAAMVQ